MQVFLTGYSWHDNTPAGSEISHPVVHRRAGGSGTYADPITVAVGHTRVGRADVLDFAAGTRFYVPSLRRYLVVEDTCGDGSRPQDRPCHDLSTAPSGARAWLDVWLDGRSVSAATATACARQLTGLRPVIMRPRADYPVGPGRGILQGGTCVSGYPDQVPG